MIQSIRSLFFLSILLISTSATAAPLTLEVAESANLIQGGAAEPGKAVVDTVLIIGPHGSDAWHNGQFETVSGIPHWQGWTSHDVTSQTTTDSWHVSTYQASGLNDHSEGNNALWCGSMAYAACSGGDEVGGYGNNITEIIQWSGTVADPDQTSLVSIDAWLNHDLEPSYDFLSLYAVLADESLVTIWETDGQATNYHLTESVTFSPGDYSGDDGDQVRLQFVVKSDMVYSDEDCFYPSIGACQIDDIRVQVDNGVIDSLSDFEDDTLGDWETLIQSTTVGDFAKIWTYLSEIDYCSENPTPQVAFIDDGIVVPGTGGTPGQSWTYGPGGFIVNNSGGLAGEGYYLHNFVQSPVLDVEALDQDGFLLEFDAYRHVAPYMEFPMILGFWQVRSTASDNPEDIESVLWRDHGYLDFGTGNTRHSKDITSLIANGAKFIQVALGVRQYNVEWEDGLDGTPAPYFDNVRLSSFPLTAPVLVVQEDHMAQDAFPENGELDLENLGTNNVRFDMALAREVPGQQRTVAGDSLVCTALSVRDGAIMDLPPRLHYRLKANPVYDAHRISGLPNEGSVEGWQVRNELGYLIPDRFAFDLPDSGFLFPGDELRYFLSATDELMGEFATTIVPADTTGFSSMSDPHAYDPVFTLRALPNVEPCSGGQRHATRILLWNDSDRESLDKWVLSLNELNLVEGIHYDLFFTNNAHSGLGNGLGQKATLAHLAGYSTILYSSGSNISNTMLEADVLLLDEWLGLEDKHLMATGDGLMSDLHYSFGVRRQFLADHFGVDLIDDFLWPLINQQSSPRIVSEPENPVFAPDMAWVAYGGCPQVNSFDAVETNEQGIQLASFTDQSGTPDYPYSAATLCQSQGTVVSLPYAFEFIMVDPGSSAGGYLSSRTWVLESIMGLFGEVYYYIVDVPEAASLEVENYPNPFNPSTTISFFLPKATHLGIKVFNMRGQLIATLMDEQYAAGDGQVVWDGTNDQGSQVSSGVYFYEVRAGDEVRITKMALIK